MDYTAHGILQARILAWADFPFSRGFSQTRSPALQVDSLRYSFKKKEWQEGMGLTLFRELMKNPLRPIKAHILYLSGLHINCL